MASPASYRPAPGSIPVDPGVYRFRDAHGRVIYVGKAKNLRQRLNSYFADPGGLLQRTRTMVHTAASVDWVTVGTEVEALQLEYNWIKEFDPRFNIRYRDDKSYPSLAVTISDEYPRLQVMRGPKRRGVRYFGPYAHAWAIRETLDLLLRVFPARTCSNGVFNRAAQTNRPCLLGYIDKCSAPCVGRVSADEHRSIVDEFCRFMSGQGTDFVRTLEKQMFAASAALDFERAARLRDDIGALQRAIEKQAVVLGDDTDADVIAFAEDPLEAAIQVFHVRGGRVRGQRGWVVDRLEEADIPALVESVLLQMYGDDAVDADVPREVLVPALPDDVEALSELLCRRRGSRVEIRIPQRGDKRDLLATVQRNAEQAFVRHKVRRASDLTSRGLALQELQDALGLSESPLRIECFDVSTLQGTETVASMVVFEDGLARKSEYRRFGVKGPATDDLSSLHEVVRRRFARYLDERQSGGALDPAPVDPSTGRARRFAYPPNLLVVDGGAPQVAATQRALDELGIDDVALCGLAKRLEEVWLPGQAEPLILPRSSEALYLLQRVRDEAHRFAITYHRDRRSKRMTVSALDTIPGLGETRRTALLKKFGSVKRLREATAEQIGEVPGIGPRTAGAIVAALATGAHDAVAVDPMTGEILPSALGE